MVTPVTTHDPKGRGPSEVVSTGLYPRSQWGHWCVWGVFVDKGVPREKRKNHSCILKM